MCLLVIVLLAWAVTRALGIALPVNVPAGLTTLALGGLVFLFALIKVLADSYRGWAGLGRHRARCGRRGRRLVLVRGQRRSAAVGAEGRGGCASGFRAAGRAGQAGRSVLTTRLGESGSPRSHRETS